MVILKVFIFPTTAIGGFLFKPGSSLVIKCLGFLLCIVLREPFFKVMCNPNVRFDFRRSLEFDLRSSPSVSSFSRTALVIEPTQVYGLALVRKLLKLSRLLETCYDIFSTTIVRLDVEPFRSCILYAPLCSTPGL